jgi:hypothetical protein
MHRIFCRFYALLNAAESVQEEVVGRGTTKVDEITMIFIKVNDIN